MITTTETGAVEAPTSEMNLPTTTVRCIECGKTFMARGMILFDRVLMPSACEPCADKRDSRLIEWVRICPIEFRLPSEAGGKTRLEVMDAASPGWRRILDWKCGQRGLLVRGATGRCKTRGMWRLLRKVFDERRKIAVLTSAQFDRQCRDAGGNFTLTPWFNQLATVDVLFLDDLGKARWTEGTEAQIFDLIDQRTREGKPILATTNDDGATLAARLSADRGEPLIRRLRDYCDTAVFGTPQASATCTGSSDPVRHPYHD